ncbi:MAG: prolyl oligopeptidase family serine peptidase, partial [Planctomycetota bacterium]
MRPSSTSSRLVRLVALVAVLLGSLPLLAAQDPPANPDPTTDLLLKLIRTNADAERTDLRSRLVALGAQRVSEAIAKLEIADVPAATGLSRHDIPCPDGFSRPAWVWLPDSYTPTTRYALIISLHGGVSGVQPQQVEGVARRWPMLIGDTKDVIVATPAADCPGTSQEARWWKNVGQTNVLALIRYIKTRHNIDDDRVFVTGHSDGGSGTFSLANRRPDWFAGFMPMCGEPRVPPSDGTQVWFENFS